MIVQEKTIISDMQAMCTRCKRSPAPHFRPTRPPHIAGYLSATVCFSSIHSFLLVLFYGIYIFLKEFYSHGQEAFICVE